MKDTIALDSVQVQLLTIARDTYSAAVRAMSFGENTPLDFDYQITGRNVKVSSILPTGYKLTLTLEKNFDGLEMMGEHVFR